LLVEGEAGELFSMPVKKNSQSQAVDSASDYAARIRALIEDDRVGQARVLVSDALEANPRDSELLSLQKVLEPPRVTPSSITDTDRTQEFRWIVANRDAYRGRWVAIQGGELVADAPTFAELQSRIKNFEVVPLVHRIA
jgi:hypothetical protein